MFWYFTIVILVLSLAGAIVYLRWRLTAIKEDLRAARGETSRAVARVNAAKQAASQAQRRCAELVTQPDSSMTSTGQALSIARHVETISRELSSLFELVRYEREVPALPARHAWQPPQPNRAPEPAAWQPPQPAAVNPPEDGSGDDAYSFDEDEELYPLPHNALPHIHRSHDGLNGASINGGTINHVRDSNG
jgi:hypothetical protein